MSFWGSANVIELYHIYKSYQKGADILVDLNLRIGKGEFVFLTGPSGAGKSTLLRLLFKAEEPTSGQILINGTNLGRLRQSSVPYLRRNIGVVFQDFKLIPQRTIFENVALSLEVLGTPKEVLHQKVFKILRSVSLHHKAWQYPPTLSGGEQQRVAIARAIVTDPVILLADEPTGNLDPEMTKEIMDILRDFNQRGATILVATHDHNLLKTYGHRTLSLDRGRITEVNMTRQSLWEVAP